MSNETLWIIALALGAVVAVIAWYLLHQFLVQVRRIEEGSGQVWAAGKQVARNTATTWQLDTLAAELDELTREALRHDALLRTGASGPTEVQP